MLVVASCPAAAVLCTSMPGNVCWQANSSSVCINLPPFCTASVVHPGACGASLLHYMRQRHHPKVHISLSTLVL
jgi:hypothetical protein